MKTIILTILAILAVCFFVFPLMICYLMTGNIRPKDVRKVCSILFKD